MTKRWKLAAVLGLALIIGVVWLVNRHMMTWRTAAVSDIPKVKVEPVKFTPVDPCDRTEDSGLTIMFMPAARYTIAARKVNVHGTVKVFVYFMHTGKIEGDEVLSQLPHGLTHEAVEATRRIRFKPTTQCGHPLAEPGEVHYDFPSGQGRVIQF